MVDNALHAEVPGTRRQTASVPQKRRSAPQESPEAGKAGPRADAGQKRASTFTLTRLQLFTTALEIYELLSSPSHVPNAPAQVPSSRLPDPTPAMLEGLRALSNGYYQFDRGLKREAYLRARVFFARAASDLLTLEGTQGLRAYVSLRETTCESSPQSAEPVSAACQALLRLEREVLPGLARLLHRQERRTGRELHSP